MEWIAIVWSGFVATTLAAAFFWLAKSVGWTEFSPSLYLGCLIIPDPRRPLTDTVGFAIVFAVGSTIAPALLRTVLVMANSVGWLAGLILGGLLGLAMAAGAPLYGTISACVRDRSIPPPGRFGIGWGRLTPTIIVGGLAVYGATFGAVYSGF